MDKISYHINEFEGPLDLILHLISKHQMDIMDIEISSLLDQYIKAIDEMKANDMDIASEFLEMASHLVYIKTVSLLPKVEDEPSAEDLKKELTGRLIEYQACKQAATFLLQSSTGFDCYTRVGEELEVDPTYTGTHLAVELVGKYQDAMGKGRRRLPPSDEIFKPLVKSVIVPISTRVNHILRELHSLKKVKLKELYQSSGSRSELIATFLAVLVLVRDAKISIKNEASEIEFTTIGAEADPNTYELSEEHGFE